MICVLVPFDFGSRQLNGNAPVTHIWVLFVGLLM